jgi:hypothetical protein
MKKEAILFFVILLVFPMVSASLSTSMEEVTSYVDQYKSKEINAPQLIVYIEYLKNKMYEELDKEGKIAFTETEIESVFEKTEVKPWEHWGNQYEKKFITDDFALIFTAHPFYRKDRAYWESRDDNIEIYYRVEYHLKAIDVEGGSSLITEIKSLIPDIRYLAENENVEKFEEMKDKFSKIKQRVQEETDNCEEFMEELDMVRDEHQLKDPYATEKRYYYIIEKKIEKDCWTKPGICDWECETVEKCDFVECTPYCYISPTDEMVLCDAECEDVCIEYEIINETPTENCIEWESCDLCLGEEEICKGCENVEESCWPEEKCHSVCAEREEVCDERTSAEIKLEGTCRNDGGIGIWVSAWGKEEGWDPLRHLNENGGEWSCDREIKELVNLRKAFQDDINNDFAIWFFEDFMNGGDYDKIFNGDHGFQNVIEILIRNEEEISERLQCSETQEWPAGFEKIEITYINNNTHVEVWEKKVPIEWANTNYHTTLYKYSWIPSKQLMKGMINYKLSEIDTFGPTAKDVAAIRADEGQMHLITSLAESYGGSFDVKLELKEEEGEIVKKYLTINPNVTVQFFDEIDRNPDISIEVDYNVLYDFIKYMSYEMEGDRIRGPRWVQIDYQSGPGKFFSTIGSMSKMWKEGVTIKPRRALLKLLFNSPEIIGLMGTGSVGSSTQPIMTVGQGEQVRVERMEKRGPVR